MDKNEDSEWSNTLPKARIRRKHKRNASEEEEPVYEGEEDFMNAIHPLEIYAPRSRKKSSPMQRAIITCINNNNGSASEEQILEYILSKWNIINKYSERGVLTEPTIRVVRLNCAVKKRSRHLFIKSSSYPNTWMLNSQQRKNHRKKPVRKIPESLLAKMHIQNASDTESSDSCNELQFPDAESDETEIKEELNEREDQKHCFEGILLEFLQSKKTPVLIEEIEEYMKPYEKEKGMFFNFPLKRRVKGCLISLKCTGNVQTDTKGRKWILNDKYFPIHSCEYDI